MLVSLATRNFGSISRISFATRGAISMMFSSSSNNLVNSRNFSNMNRVGNFSKRSKFSTMIKVENTSQMSAIDSKNSTEHEYSPLRLMDKVPNFKVPIITSKGLEETFELEKNSGKWLVLMFYPADFTFVCPTEILNMSDNVKKFNEVNAEVIVCSTDTIHCHRAWREKPRSEGGIGNVEISMASDSNHRLSKLFNVLNSETGLAARGLFIIDDEGTLVHILVSHDAVGRNCEDALRVIEGIQLHRAQGSVCPARWKVGDKGMEMSLDGVKNHLN